MANQSQTEALSFPQAIAATQSLMNQTSANQLSEAEIQQQISSILNTKNGGRGFFVAYLTSELPLADNPSTGVIDGLRSASLVTSELLVKNLAMSSAMAVVHARNSDLENLKGSQKVERRTRRLIQEVDLKAIEEELQKLQDTIETGKGEYTDFLNRWSYDREQKQAIQKAISNAIAL